jgi:glycosyltransferase involved in cell wall biosynthesis
MRRVLFFGAINENQAPLGGEEYKNQLILHKLKNENIQLQYIDTINWKQSPLVVLNLFCKLFLSNFDSIIISASSVSTYRLLNLTQWIKPDILNQITYLVIGGYFPEGIRTKRFNWKSYSKLKNVVVEGELLRQLIISNSNLSNVQVVPNFKMFPNLAIKDRFIKNEKFRFVFVGRISNAKGINEILEAVEILKGTNEEFEIDFYGPEEERFDFNNNDVKYCGFIDFQNDSERSYLKLAEYNCMLFPTYWMGEGFPGVIIDALIAGLPVIATDWNMNKEIIQVGINGYLIKPKSTIELVEKMKFVMKNQEALTGIRANNIKMSKNYHIDTIWPKITSILE